MWRLLISSLCMGYIVWAQTSDLAMRSLKSHLIVNNDTKPTSCKNVRYINVTLVKTVLNNGAEVLCDTQTDNGGWTIIQRRHNGEQSFDRSFCDYVNGFGGLDGDFWIGLRLMNEFTYKRCYTLRIEFDIMETRYHAQYSFFKVFGKEDNYTLNIGTHSGTAGDALRVHDGQQFTTKDRDNDLNHRGNCAVLFGGGWWFNACYNAFLNAEWRSDYLNWYPEAGSSIISSTQMKIRPCVTALD